MAKLVPGVNDLATLHPDVAAEADGWDPSTIHAGSNKKMPWKCEEGHTWNTTVVNRTGRGDGCPYCSNRKLWV
ncbi:MAG TPA: zinc-ribbon domain-containing protein, partial [Prochlorococcus sp.]